MIQVLAFYLFAIVTVLAGVLCVTARNPVHSVLWLILAFFNSAGLMVLVGAEFIAMLLVIVYVGAVAVLFLFVVMMLDIDFAQLRSGTIKYLPAGIALVALLAIEIIVATGAWSVGGVELNRTAPTPDTVPNIQALGILIYTRYLYIFEAAGLVLLVALIGAIVLTHRKRGGVRTQRVADQNRRRPQDAIRNTQPTVGQGVEL
ncbi:NADH-quinone oxidoreductase subunit J [uncultured Sphingomonas sp.]|uniref:NADH-quinone oxidoreductase subunit J n=1 Tax=uncultured Sphingomonas sp. TaxID=158754 RepID=UPI0025EE7519|nr:NADH-quinone oxidoreductase subunit J [uncultured Sphingomonas sp.]